MSGEVGTLPPLIEWAVAVRPIPGESECGDLHLVRALPHGVLLAAVDGLGHGHWAAEAARLAVATLDARAGEALLDLVQGCHERLKGTRGVVMTLALIGAHDGAMTWLGVGNVDGLLLRADPGGGPAREYVLLRGGVVGEQLPPLRSSVTTLKPSDTLLFTTDGIRHGYADGLDLSDPPQAIANQILATHGKSTDDALVLVARYLGRQ